METEVQAARASKRQIRYSLMLVACLLLGVGFFSFGFAIGHHSQPANVDSTSSGTPAGTGGISLAKPVADWQPSDISIYDLWNQTNQQRQANGLQALSLSPLLANSASTKCADMVAKNYWAHNDPTGQEPWHFLTDAGVNYGHAGENLAEGFDDASAVMTGWMNSEEHKANILNANFTQVGFAVCKANVTFSSVPNTLIVVQHFTD